MAADSTWPSAASKALDITELLEDVLLHLPLRDLLFAKRISARFRDVVVGSSRIRKALFFEPLTLPTNQELAAMDRYQLSRPPDWRRKTEILPDGLPKFVAINPLLDNYVHFSRFGEDTFLTWIDEHLLSRIGRLSIEVDQPSLRRREVRNSHSCASWRQMFFLQPHAAAMYAYTSSTGYSEDLEPVSLRSGLSLEELFDYHQRQLESDFPWRLRGVELHHGLSCTLGQYHQTSLPEGKARKHVVNEICGWDVLASQSQEPVIYAAPVNIFMDSHAKSDGDLESDGNESDWITSDDEACDTEEGEEINGGDRDVADSIQIERGFLMHLRSLKLTG